MENEELIVTFHRTKTEFALMACVILVFYIWYNLLDLTNLKNNAEHSEKNLAYSFIFIYEYIFPTLQLLGIMFFLYQIFKQINRSMVAKLTQDGIWIQNYGFIHWSEIKEIKQYVVNSQVVVLDGGIIPAKSRETMGIWVQDPSKLSKQASLKGKLSLFLRTLFDSRNPSIIFAHIRPNHHKIIAFAKQHMQNTEYH